MSLSTVHPGPLEPVTALRAMLKGTLGAGTGAFLSQAQPDTAFARRIAALDPALVPREKEPKRTQG